MLKFNRASLPAFAAAAFAIALQVQITFFKTVYYEGLRISAADLLIPLAGLAIAASLFLKRSDWPRWKRPFAYGFPVLMTLGISAAMLNGYFVQGELSHWALLNKFVGWFVLMAYLGAGAWFSTNYQGSFLPVFVKVFCYFALLVVAMEAGNEILLGRNIDTGWRFPEQTIYGFMANRNAFAFLIVIASVFFMVGDFRGPRFILPLFWGLFPTLFVFNGARTLWICIPVLLAVFAYCDWKKTCRIVLPGLLAGLLFFYLAFTPVQQDFFLTLPVKTTTSLVEYAREPDAPEVQSQAEAYGNKQRFYIASGAIELIKKYPLQGAGLGSALYFQQKETGNIIDIIDCTPLWLLTETGIIGFAIFIVTYAFMAAALWKSAGPWSKPDNRLALAALIMMMCFGMFSLFHEILYTRFFWFILGLALAVPKTHPDSQAS